MTLLDIIIVQMRKHMNLTPQKISCQAQIPSKRPLAPTLQFTFDDPPMITYQYLTMDNLFLLLTYFSAIKYSFDE